MRDRDLIAPDVGPYVADGALPTGVALRGRWSLGLAFTTASVRRTRLVAHVGTPAAPLGWVFGLDGTTPFVEVRTTAARTLRAPPLPPGLHVAIVQGDDAEVRTLILDGVRHERFAPGAVLRDDLGPFAEPAGLTLGGLRDLAGGHADLRFGLDDDEDLLQAVLRAGWTERDGPALQRAARRSRTAPDPPDARDVTPVFVPGEGGYAGFRIPGLLRLASGALLATCEGRVETVSDSCPTKDLVIKRSHDGGRSWSAIQVAVRGGDPFGGATGSAMNPSLLHDAVHGSGRTLLAFTALDANEWAVQAGRARAHLRIAESLDDGRTWRPPRPLIDPDAVPADLSEVFPDLAGAPPAMRVPSLGHGLQLTRGPARGRMLVCGNATYGRQSVFDSVLHLLWSDDAGTSWRFGPTPARWRDGRPATGLNETSLAETADGGVFASIRAYRDGRPTGRRALCRGRFADDGTFRWAPVHDAADLTAPAVHGAATSWTAPDGGHRVAVSHPHHPGERRALAVRIRRPTGTWSRPLRVRDGFSAYSDLAYHPADDALIVVFEDSLDGAIAAARIADVSRHPTDPELP